MSLVMGVGITALSLGLVAGSHSGSDEAAVGAFQRCDAVTDALGSPIEKVPWRMSCGEYEGGGNHGEANWSITVRGPKGQASGWYSASYVGDDPWQVHAATLDLADGRTIRAVPCMSGSPAPEPPSRDRERDRDRDPDERRSKGGKGKRR